MSVRKFILPVLFTLSVATSGCATIIQGGQPRLNVQVDDPTDNVTVIVMGLNNGERYVRHEANFSVPLNRNSDYMIRVKAPDYETEEVIVHRNIRGWFWANLCCTWSWLGMIADYATGSMWEPDRSEVSFHLDKVQRHQSSMVLPIEVLAKNGQVIDTLDAPIHGVKQSS